MEARTFIFVILAVWIAGVAAFFYAAIRRLPYQVAFMTCFRWTIAIVSCMAFNYWLADKLELSKGSSGYIRGKQVISPYAFLVQMLLILEIGALLLLIRLFKRRQDSEVPNASIKQHRAGPHQPKRTTRAAPSSPFSAPLANPNTDDSRVRDSSYSIGTATLFFLLCAVGNFWLGFKALQVSAYGAVFVLVAVALVIAAVNVSRKPDVRRE